MKIQYNKICEMQPQQCSGGKLIVLIAYIRKEKKSQTNNQNFNLKNQEKEQSQFYIIKG